MFCKMNYNFVNGVCDLVYNSESGKKPSAKSTNKRHSGCSWNITGLRKEDTTNTEYHFLHLVIELHHSELRFCLGSSLNDTGETIMAESASEIHQEELKLGSHGPKHPTFLQNSRLNTLKVAW